MPFVYADRVKETTTTTGTGTLSLAGPAAGFQGFVGGIGTTNTGAYCLLDANGIAWEVGIGTVTDGSPDTLSRTTILASSNAGAAINLSAGTHTVFCTHPATLIMQGPASAVDSRVAMFDGTTGRLIKDSGLTLSGTNTGDQTNVTGNAGTATALQNARTIGGVSFDGSANITQPYDVHAQYPGVPTADAYLLLPTKAARALGVPANFADSTFTATANATASTVFTVLKNGSSIGTVTIAAGTVTPTFATSGGAAQSYAAGDTYAVQAPATPDATLADPSFVFLFTR